MLTTIDAVLRGSLLPEGELPRFALVAAIGVVVVLAGTLSTQQVGPGHRRWPAVTWYRLPPVLVVASLVGVVLTVGWAVHSGHVSPRGFVDLSVYRLGVDAWWHDANLYGVLPLTGVGLALPFTYPPFAVLALGPLAVPPWQVSIACITALSLLSLAVVAYVTVRAAWPGGGKRGAIVAGAAVVPLALTLEPVADTVWFGQVNLFLMALVVLDCLLARTRWPRGLLVGIAAAIKLTPAVFVVYFLLRKDFRAALTATVAAAVATGIGFAVDWSGSVTFWFGGSGGAHAVGDPSTFTNQSLIGGLARVGLTGVQQAAAWLLVIPVVALFAAAGVRRALREDDTPLAVVLTATFGLLASPISWSHHWVWAVPAIIVLVARGLRAHEYPWLIAAAGVYIVGHAAAFADPDLATHSATMRLLELNSYALTAAVLLLGYGRTGVANRVRWLLCWLRDRIIGRRAPVR